MIVSSALYLGLVALQRLCVVLLVESSQGEILVWEQPYHVTSTRESLMSWPSAKALCSLSWLVLDFCWTFGDSLPKKWVPSSCSHCMLRLCYDSMSSLLWFNVILWLLLSGNLFFIRAIFYWKTKVQGCEFKQF